jgi:hypothetical protein
MLWKRKQRLRYNDRYVPLRYFEALTMTRVLIPLARTFILTLALIFIASSFAFAQETAPAKKPAASSAPAKGEPKKTTVNFEDQLIEGQTQKPELFYLLQQRNNNFKRLIKLRENFLPEMRKTGEDVSRSGQRSSGPQAAK